MLPMANSYIEPAWWHFPRWSFLWSAPEQTGSTNNPDAHNLRCHRAHYDVTVRWEPSQYKSCFPDMGIFNIISWWAGLITYNLMINIYRWNDNSIFRRPSDYHRSQLLVRVKVTIWTLPRRHLLDALEFVVSAVHVRERYRRVMKNDNYIAMKKSPHLRHYR